MAYVTYLTIKILEDITHMPVTFISITMRASLFYLIQLTGIYQDIGK